MACRNEISKALKEEIGLTKRDGMPKLPIFHSFMKANGT